jgi:NAD(P)H-hydrate epimerase
MICGTKIVSAKEMQKLDKTSPNPEALMDNAADAIVSAIDESIKTILLLVGKGNNGADALTAGTLLLRQKRRVFAMLLYPTQQLSPLCKARLQSFKKAGGTLFSSQPFSLIIDGIVGTGFHGTPDLPMTKAIEWANSQDTPILAIDIPSGLDGTTGEVASVAIKATFTCSLGLPKIGFFIHQGWNHVGKLLNCDIGLDLTQAKPTALLLQEQSLKLPPLLRTQHKYQAGYVLGIGGSLEMPGAPALSSLAALRSGAGIIRLFTHADMPRYPLAPEVICETIHFEKILKEMERADALFIGPGLGRTESTQKFLQKLLPLLTKPTVIDGDALYNLSPPQGSILTPHQGEMIHLLNGASPTLKNCSQYVEKHQVALVLKGAPTFIFYPGKLPLIITAGDPGMATAGSGDVLTGIIAALLAKKMTPSSALALAVYLHGKTGELAAQDNTSYSLIASDLIAYLPEAFLHLNAAYACGE